MPHPKTPVTNYHHKQVKHTENSSVYHKACHTDLQTSMKSLNSILSIPKFPNFLIISHGNYCDSLYFHENALKKCLNCSKIPRIPSRPWFSWRSCARKSCGLKNQWCSEVSKQIWNQQSTLQFEIRGQGVRVSLVCLVFQHSISISTVGKETNTLAKLTYLNSTENYKLKN